MVGLGTIRADGVRAVQVEEMLYLPGNGPRIAVSENTGTIPR